jgi:hypothetical protein
MSTFTMMRVFIGVDGTSTNLERSVWRQVVAGQSGGAASCRHVATEARAEPPQTLVGWSRRWAGRPAPGPTQPGVWPTLSICQIQPHGDDDFYIWLTSLCDPLKCSNLVPKFLK